MMILNLNDRWAQRLRHDRGALAAAAGLSLIVAFSVLGPVISPYQETEQSLQESYDRPSAKHWFGMDGLGRDLMTRVMHGGRVSIAVGVMGAALSILIGVTVGGFAGIMGGIVESFIMRAIDFLYGIPLLLIVIALMVILGQGLGNVFIALGLVYWLGMARVVRARVDELREREFVEAARSLGAGKFAIFMRHILPNTTGVIVVTATFMIPQAIFAESFLSFLGLGVNLPHASWGTLAAEGLGAMRSHPHVLAFPATAICLTMFAFQTVGEGLRAALDPREAEFD
ncbi:ABC transporter permease [Candidatus Sumerlaeota bacterium]|nr:ABC transporter permease [Candidatus Sumerlaeota bacterium]